MKLTIVGRFLLVALAGLVFTVPTVAQITSNEGDSVINAPYRGTIDTLRECSMNIGYGEVQSHVEPTSSGVSITSSTIEIWVDGEWGRSALRMYEGLDASEDEIDLTGTSELSPAVVYPDIDDIKRLSFKAIGTKTLGEQDFAVRFSYSVNGSPVSPTRVFTVAPITGSFCNLAGESEAYILGTPILDVAVGNARLTVPVGRTAEMIGAAFSFRDRGLGPSAIERSDVVLPGAAESVFIQNISQFKLGGGSLSANKTDWGTPWPGHLVGFFNSSDVYGPDGTHYDTPTVQTDGMNRFNCICPLRQGTGHPASVRYDYDDGFNNRVIKIRDGATTTPNFIELFRNDGVVTDIATSDGRAWQIQNDAVDGWITGIIPSGSKGARFFAYNSAGRVTQVKDADGAVMYEFTYVNDSGGMPTILTEERRFVDGALQTVVEHEVVSESLCRRKEFTAPGEFRQFDFHYDVANGLNHRLASITAYKDVNAGGATYPTVYAHDVDSPNGCMVITNVSLPDGTSIAYEYDSHIGGQAVDFGFHTKSTRVGPNDGSLVTFDVDYEFFYEQSGTRLFYLPRIVKQRDGRGVLSEVTFDYDDGGEYVDPSSYNMGQDLNRLLSITGPSINTGPSGSRTPQTRFQYDDGPYGPYVLLRQETDYAAGLSRAVEFTYDELFRITSETADPGGEDIVTRYLYCDGSLTQDRTTVDPEGYWTRTRFDNDGRVTGTERFLDVDAGNLADPCEDPTGPVYRTTTTYDVYGWLDEREVENKDQNGDLITPTTIVTEFEHDRLGWLDRVALQPSDPGGADEESHFDYSWLGEVERQYDTSGRGVSYRYDGRGLVYEQTPLAVGENPDTNLTTTYEYDAKGNLRIGEAPTGAVEERIYDDFGRLEQTLRIPGLDGGNVITTTIEYDDASNVTRALVDEGGTALSDTTWRYDEGGYNFESRQRLSEGTNDDDHDPVIQRKFDWAGNVIEERSFGDDTVADRVITIEHDDAGRVERILDSEGGDTEFIRDDRGNVLDQIVKIDVTDSAVTTTEYDALSRATLLISPEDGDGGRPGCIRRYNSSDNLLRETCRNASDVAEMTTVFAYDNAGRQTRSAVLADATSTIAADEAEVENDRVVDSEYDTDGRLRFQWTYNNDAPQPLGTEITYDSLGRVDRATDPSESYVDRDYADNGRLSQTTIFDKVGTRLLVFGYDGHDRITQQTALGPPDLTTTFAFDGLNRPVRKVNPRNIASRTDYDLIGRRIRLVEDEGGSLERQTEFGHNRLSQATTRTVKNRSSTGVPLDDQVTTYRYDSLGRRTRIVYPDSNEHATPESCSDCVRIAYDVAGRMTERTDQRSRLASFGYDERGLLLTRTTDSDRDTFEYDGVGRLTLAQRGTVVDPDDPDAVSGSVRDYTDLGDLDFDVQTIADGTARTVDFDYDQAGNRVQLSYPGGEELTYVPTSLNQVDTVDLNASEFLDYDYLGRLLDTRRTITSAPGGTTSYTNEIEYDVHRRVGGITNRLDVPGRGSEVIVVYDFTHDDNGNPLSQTITEGMEAFVANDRVFTPDRLDRLIGTEYLENGQVESTVFDLVGNRETHTDRTGAAKAYVLENAANEYDLVGPDPLSYDEAGNLSVDEDGRQYFYDEQNRLTQIEAASKTVLARYTYDALGRRIVFEDPVAGTTIRYYYDGDTVIEERDGSDTRLRYHVNGAQYVDERVATYNDGRAGFTYYLPGDNYSISGSGNPDGSVIERLDYSSTGDFAGGGPGASGYFHDADDDLDIDLRDFASFQVCFEPSGGGISQACLDLHDWDATDSSDDDIDLDDYARFIECSEGPFLTPGPSCGQARRRGSPPPSGTFALHGRPTDVLSDGHTLMSFRARYYDPANGRWLQRDPIPYNDGSNLYESFRGNATVDRDPFGKGVLTWLLVGDYELSDWSFVRENTYRVITTPTYGFFEGAGQTIAGGATELWRIPAGESEAQQRLVNLVEAEFDLGGATADETYVVMLRATGQGMSDFFGASNITTAATGEQVVFDEEGQVFVVDVGAFERVQAGFAGVGQFAGTVGGLGGGGLGRAAATNTVRARVLANIAESQAARAASRFEVFAAREHVMAISRGGSAPVRAGRAGVASVVAELDRAGFGIAGREITIQTTAARTRLDLLVEAPLEGGAIPGTSLRASPLQKFFVEVKTGPAARLTQNQRLAFPEIRVEGGIPKGLKAELAKLVVGEKSEAFQVIVIRR